MKKRNLFRNILLISFAVIFVAAAGIGEAWSYFTTYARAEGGAVINLGFKTTIWEEYKEGMKHIRIENQKGSQPVYVRVKAYCENPDGLDYSSDDNRWTGGSDGYWYYTEILKGGESTAELKVKITFPANAEDGDVYNVVVIYESTPVRYNEHGEPYAYNEVDWTATLDTGRSEGGIK